MKKLFLIFIFLIPDGSVYAANTTLLNNDDITVGDDIMVKIDAGDFDLTLLPKDAFFKLNPGGFTLRRCITEDGSLILTLAAFKTGTLLLDSFEIRFSDGKTLKTDPLSIEIKSVLDPNNSPSDILDIMPIINFTRGIMLYIIIAASIIFMAVCFYAVNRYAKKRKRNNATRNTELLIPPREFALLELEKLKNLRLIEQHRVKEYYDKMSDIVRYYISRAYNIDLMEKTTSEIYGILKTLIAHTDNVTLKNFLQTCDFVKFANSAPDAESCESDFDAAKGFVEKL